MTPEPLLEVQGLTKHYAPPRTGVRRRADDEPIVAVDDVSFRVDPGETLSLVGESGCGKTTIARLLLRLIEPTAGRAFFRARDASRAVDLFTLSGRALRNARRELGLVFQDPYESLNPRMTVGDIVAEGLVAHRLARGAALRSRVEELLEEVGLPATARLRHPHEFSGGQRQRIGIARALATRPRLVVLDEAVSALDVSIQAQILNLLRALRERSDVAYLFIAHDLSVVRHVSDRVAVMRAGRLVETGTRDEIFERPTHPYTRALLAATPVAAPGRHAARRSDGAAEGVAPAAPGAGEPGTKS